MLPNMSKNQSVRFRINLKYFSKILLTSTVYSSNVQNKSFTVARSKILLTCRHLALPSHHLRHLQLALVRLRPHQRLPVIQHALRPALILAGQLVTARLVGVVHGDAADLLRRRRPPLLIEAHLAASWI